MPLAVVKATSTADVQTTVRIAAAARLPVVPRGAGSGLSGGSSAIAGGIVLSLDRMREIDIDQKSIIVACSRVVGAKSSLSGYAWNEERKHALLDFKAGVVAAPQ